MDVFRVGGHGGQKVNKTNSGVRWTHPPSGAVGESRESRSQADNKVIAWRRMAEHPKMKAWLKLETARRTGEEAAIEAEVKRQMEPQNLKVEVVEDGEWVTVPS